jgi:hypothetical protein
VKLNKVRPTGIYPDTCEHYLILITLTLVLGDTLQRAPKLRQFKCLMPGRTYKDEIIGLLESIPRYMRPSTVLKLVCGRDIGVDETPFWEAPSLEVCMAAGEDDPNVIQVVVTGLEPEEMDL